MCNKMSELSQDPSLKGKCQDSTGLFEGLKIYLGPFLFTIFSDPPQ